MTSRLRQGAGLLIAAATVACQYVNVTIEASPFPVGTENQAVFDAQLVGQWRSDATEESEPSELTIRSSDGRTYQVILREGDDADVLNMSGFVVDVGTMHLLNARLDESGNPHVSGYMSFRYQLEIPDGLLMWPIETDAMVKNGVTSATELFQYLKDKAGDTTLYGDLVRFQRVSLWGRASRVRVSSA
jgi:hypothetical protein